MTEVLITLLEKVFTSLLRFTLNVDLQATLRAFDDNPTEYFSTGLVSQIPEFCSNFFNLKTLPQKVETPRKSYEKINKIN